MYKSRYLEKTIKNLTESIKVIYLAGSRQVGKTTLLKYLATERKMGYVSLDNLQIRKLAQEDPELFLQKYPAPLLIDEVQYAPQLFPYIKINVDGSDKNGLYWLTGSQQFAIMKNVKESLAGRIGILNLAGFSLAEDLELAPPQQPFLPSRINNEKIKALSANDIFKVIHRGSFPVLTHKNPPPLEIFYNSFLQTYIDRDLKELFHVSKITSFNKFIQLCAARTGQILNYSDLARDADISVHAAQEWLNVLISSFQVYLLEPYYKNISKRMIKAPKLYFWDTGLAAYLTRWKTPETLFSGAMAGAFFENFVVSEIMKSYWHRGETPPVYYLRDKEGHEVDLIIERDNVLYPVEIKMSGSVQEKYLRNIKYYREKISNMGRGAIVSLTQNHLPLDREEDLIPVTLIN
ncbi:ATP-binding protein [Candidatus Saganbacteria bacterium]|nr:ATP-binding protein [Candidatus Saganbacteria bacterium]